MTVYVAEGGAIDWSPRLAARMILSGVQVGDKPWPRRRVARQVRRAFAHWWTWTTALPGEVFRDGPCDMLFQVAGGIGANRTVRPLAAEDLARGISFQNVEARACPFRWCRLELERETSWRDDDHRPDRTKGHTMTTAISEGTTAEGNIYRVEWDDRRDPVRVIVDGQERGRPGLLIRRYRGSGEFLECADGTLKLAQIPGRTDHWTPSP